MEAEEQEEQMGRTETPESLFCPSQNLLNETCVSAGTPPAVSVYPGVQVTPSAAVHPDQQKSCIPVSLWEKGILFQLSKVCTLCVELRKFCLLGRENLLQKSQGTSVAALSVHMFR